MTFLLFLNFLGIIASFLAYLCVLFGFSFPADAIAIAVDIGIFVVLSMRLIITSELRQSNDWFFDKSIKNLCPFRLKVTIGFIITYGILNSIFSLIGMFSKLSVTMTKSDYEIARKKLFIGLFLLTMAYYAVEFFMLYSYKILKEKMAKIGHN